MALSDAQPRSLEARRSSSAKDGSKRLSCNTALWTQYATSRRALWGTAPGTQAMFSHQQVHWRAETTVTARLGAQSVVPAGLCASWPKQYNSMQQPLSSKVVMAGHKTARNTSCISHLTSSPESQAPRGGDQMQLPIPQSCQTQEPCAHQRPSS